MYEKFISNIVKEAGKWGSGPYDSDSALDFAWELEIELLRKAKDILENHNCYSKFEKVGVIIDLLTHIKNNSVDEAEQLWSEVKEIIYREVDERSKDGEEELLTVSHITGVTSRSEKDVNMFLAESLEGYKKCQKGDLVINTMWAWMGAMGTSNLSGIVSPSYNVYRQRDEGRIEPDFIDYLVRIPPFVSFVTSRSKGIWSSRLRLYPEAFFNIQLAIPSKAVHRVGQTFPTGEIQIN